MFGPCSIKDCATADGTQQLGKRLQAIKCSALAFAAGNIAGAAPAAAAAADISPTTAGSPSSAAAAAAVVDGPHLALCGNGMAVATPLHWGKVLMATRLEPEQLAVLKQLQVRRTGTRVQQGPFTNQQPCLRIWYSLVAE